METKYTLTGPVKDSEWENHELSWTARGILFYAAFIGTDLTALTVERLQDNSPGRESNDELRAALDELVSFNLMQVSE